MFFITITTSIMQKVTTRRESYNLSPLSIQTNKGLPKTLNYIKIYYFITVLGSSSRYLLHKPFITRPPFFLLLLERYNPSALARWALCFKYSFSFKADIAPDLGCDTKILQLHAFRKQRPAAENFYYLFPTVANYLNTNRQEAKFGITNFRAKSYHSWNVIGLIFLKLIRQMKMNLETQ